MEPSTSQFLNDNTDVSTLYEVQRYTVYDLRKNINGELIWEN